jgi:nitrite reductase/ring-hydroxylating ferredoxin subunit
MSQTDFVASIKDSELQEGKFRAVRIKGKPILLLRVGSQVFAVSNYCPHMGCALQGGNLSGYVLMCGCHGWKFDIRSGEHLDNPLTKLTCYPCKVENGKIFIEVKREW